MTSATLERSPAPAPPRAGATGTPKRLPARTATPGLVGPVAARRPINPADHLGLIDVALRKLPKWMSDKGARQPTRRELADEDLRSDARLALVKAGDYRPEPGGQSFASYAVGKMTDAMGNYLIASRTRRQGVPLDAIPEPQTEARSTLDVLAGAETDQRQRSVMDDLLGVLTERQRRAIELRYLGEQMMGYADVGKRLGISWESARELVERAVHKMQDQARRLGVQR